MSESRWDAYITVILRHRKVCLCIFLIVCGILGYQLKSSKPENDPSLSLYPVKHPYLPVMRQITEMTGEPSTMVCILEVKQGDIYNAGTIRKIDDITRALMEIDGIRPDSITSPTRGIDYLKNSVDGLLPKPVPDDKWPEIEAELKTLTRKSNTNAMGIGRYVAYDGTAVMITADLMDIDRKFEKTYDQLPGDEKEKVSLKTFKQQQSVFRANLLNAMRGIKQQTDDDGHTFYFMGQEILRAQTAEMKKHHIPLAAVIMLGIMAAFLGIYFKTLQGVVVPMASMLFSIILCTGIYAWHDSTLNSPALLFPLILGMLVMALIVLILKHYCRSCGRGNQMREALSETYQRLPVAGSVVTLGLVVGSLLAANVPMIRELGIMGMIWGVAAFAVIMVMTPVLISLFPVPGLDRIELSRIPQRPVEWMPGDSRRRMFQVGTIALLVTGVICIATLQVGGNIPGTSCIRQSHPWNQCFNKLAEKFISPFQFLVYVQAEENNGIADPEVIQAIGNFSRYLIDEAGAEDCISIGRIIRMTRAALKDGHPKWQTIPADKDKIVELAGGMISRGNAGRFIDNSLSRAVIWSIFPEKDARHIDTYASVMQAYIDDHPVDKVMFSIGGGLLGRTKALNDGTRTTWKRTFAAGFIVVLISAVLVTGKLSSGFTVTVALIPAQILLCLVMKVFQIPVSLATIPAFAPAAGFGAVAGYVMIRKRSERTGGLSRSVMLVVSLSLLTAVALLPWWFIGMAPQSTMIAMFSLGVVLNGIAAAICIPLIQVVSGGRIYI